VEEDGSLLMAAHGQSSADIGVSLGHLGLWRSANKKHRYTLIECPDCFGYGYICPTCMGGVPEEDICDNCGEEGEKSWNCKGAGKVDMLLDD